MTVSDPFESRCERGVTGCRAGSNDVVRFHPLERSGALQYGCPRCQGGPPRSSVPFICRNGPGSLDRFEHEPVQVDMREQDLAKAVAQGEQAKALYQKIRKDQPSTEELITRAGGPKAAAVRAATAAAAARYEVMAREFSTDKGATFTA